MISLEELLSTYNISREQYEIANISWEDLEYIYADFSKKQHYYEEILEKFQREYIADTSRAHIHSYRARIKDPEHLIVKIIRKRFDAYKKYSKLNKDNYENFITDIIGFRAFILFKEEWVGFHQFMMDAFVDDESNYVKDWSIKNWKDKSFVEPPKVHIRAGDNRNIYLGHIRDSEIHSNKIYRSVHYTVCYQDTLIEIQLRTLFEESWGEIDHSVVYPYYQEDKFLKEYSELMNRLSGLADEMGSYFLQLKGMRHRPVHLEEQEEIQQDTADMIDAGELEGNSKECPPKVDAEQARTPKEIIRNIINY